jgi:hypothetical protein
VSTDGQGGGFFSRWSRQKTAQRAAEVKPNAPTAPTAPPAAPAAPAATAKVGQPVVSTVATNTAATSAAPTPLPKVEELTPQSDYTAFMAPDVAPALRSQALKKLFTDPHFNVMDGLDTYIDDYGKPDPIPESWYGRMNRIAGDMRPLPEDPAAAIAEQSPASAATGQQPDTDPATPPATNAADETADQAATATPALSAEAAPSTSTVPSEQGAQALQAPTTPSRTNA